MSQWSTKKDDAATAKRLLLGITCSNCYYYRANPKEKCIAIKNFERLAKDRHCAFFKKYESDWPIIEGGYESK